MKLKTIHIDDDQELLDRAYEIINEHEIGKHQIIINDKVSFSDGLNLIAQNDYDLIILDLCVGKASEESDKVGEEIYNKIRDITFSPIVFFTGLPQYVEPLTSDIVKVASKGIGYDQLFDEIEAIISTDYLDIKSNVNKIVKESLRTFFWDFVHEQKDMIDKMKDNTSLSYVLFRRLAKMLSKEQLKKFVQDEQINPDLTHPIEFYLYPPLEGEYEAGDILRQNESGDIYIVLTPSCDLVNRPKKGRKAELILLIKAINFSELDDYKALEILIAKENKKKEDHSRILNLKGKITNWMRNNQGDKDRYFYLPETPFIRASLIDFQHKQLVTYDQLKKDFSILTRLDDPYAQSAISSFTRYYNRIGFPDLDIEYSFNQLFSLVN